jgi:hypothetical protein
MARHRIADEMTRLTGGSFLAMFVALMAIGCGSSTPAYCGDAGFEVPVDVYGQWETAVSRLCGTNGVCLYDGGADSGCNIVGTPYSTAGSLRGTFCQGFGDVGFQALCNPAGAVDVGLILDAGSCKDLSVSAFPPAVCDGQISTAP